MADKKISALTSASTPLAGTEVLPIVQSGSTVKVPVSDLTAGRDVAAQSMTVNQSGMTTPASFGQFPGSTSYGQVNFNGATTLGGLSGLIGGGSSGTMFLNVPTGGTLNLLNGGGFVLQLGASDATVSTGNLIQGTAAKGVNFTANTPAAGKTSQLLNWYEEGTWTPTDASGAGLSFTISDAKYTRTGRLVQLNALITFPATASALNVTIGGLPFVCGNYSIGQLIGFFGVSGCVTASATLSTLFGRDLTGNTITNLTLSTKDVAISIAYLV
jgi:hypothetical protein